MKNFRYFFLISFILVTLPTVSISALTNLRFAVESGLYQTQNSAQHTNLNLVSRFSGGFKLQESTTNSVWTISLQVNPDFYQGDFSYSSVKFFARGQYAQKKNKWQWGTGFDARKYSYFSEVRNSTFDLFKLDGFFSFLIARTWNFSINPSYYYRDLATQKLDAFATPFHLVTSIGKHMNLGFGSYLEHFELQADFLPDISQTNQTNNGWRLGPEFTLTYLKKIYFNLHYLYLWHNSRITQAPSFEQYLRLLFSRKLSNNWILFFIVDYFWNEIHLLENYHEGLAYIPYENENHIDVKLEKLIRKNLFLSIRAGYFKDNFILSEFSIEGWQALIGLDFEP